MPRDRVHAEAEVLEHYISEDLEALIAAKLGEPSHDPHGNPIPGPDLAPPAVPTLPPSGFPGDER
jgi:DtxR family Mn-dependent transcriptional regulator